MKVLPYGSFCLKPDNPEQSRKIFLLSNPWREYSAFYKAGMNRSNVYKIVVIVGDLALNKLIKYDIINSVVNI